MHYLSFPPQPAGAVPRHRDHRPAQHLLREVQHALPGAAGCRRGIFDWCRGRTSGYQISDIRFCNRSRPFECTHSGPRSCAPCAPARAAVARQPVFTGLPALSWGSEHQPLPLSCFSNPIETIATNPCCRSARFCATSGTCPRCDLLYALVPVLECQGCWGRTSGTGCRCEPAPCAICSG